MQRLTRIKQVGLSSVVYPGAQHTRFQHSLGAFYLMSEAITQLASKGNFIFDSEAEAVQAAILPPRIRKIITDLRRAVPLPFLKRQLDIINPDFIFTLGGSAANALLDTADSISKMRGRWMEYTKSNGQKAMVLASFHPAYLLRTPGQKAKAWSDVLRLYKQMNSEKES